ASSRAVRRHERGRLPLAGVFPTFARRAVRAQPPLSAVVRQPSVGSPDRAFRGRGSWLCVYPAESRPARAPGKGGGRSAVPPAGGPGGQAGARAPFFSR